MRPLLVLALLAVPALAAAQSNLAAELDRRARDVEAQVVTWRRDFHQHPELSNREARTGKIVADYLKSLGLEVRYPVAHNGVVATLRGGRPGPVVALRADMDALPVTEEVDLPFKSTVRTTFNGQEVGVMHACGHDGHTAMLMGAATILAGMRDRLPGTVKFIFQPAEEGVPPGEQGGAPLMIREGALENPKVDAIFGLHVFPMHTGEIHYKAGGIMASSDRYQIVVNGKQTHGAQPWGGVDPIVVSSQIIMGLQTIISRQADITKAPAVVTVGRINGGIRFNIIPDSVFIEGTVRTFDPAMRDDIFARIRRTAESIAAASGATARVIVAGDGNPPTVNDPALMARMLPTLQRVAGQPNVKEAIPTTTAEDFSYYMKSTPGIFYFLGVTPKDRDVNTVARNHSPKFFVDEAALPLGTRSLAAMAIDYLTLTPSRPAPR
ncbi:MAG TPA: amidohydrolase [Gemmatimonadaceae bacterium]|nr:amidohydrolase [Gemmatimonadaceae bacterium]